MIFRKKLVAPIFEFHCYLRKFSAKSQPLKTALNKKDDPKLIRNIGILAHIDAGKTTTTERMLFFSGSISHMGEVHHGNTVTDFMEQERERGITITSASVTFEWEKHKINLLDTPGHIDFTMEVEQTLSVMDGAIIILDGCSGVEAQTLTVWRQANRYSIPRIMYVNKMDRPKAELKRCEASIKDQLGAIPLLLQLPIFDQGHGFVGVVDLLNLKKYKWSNISSSTHFTQSVLQPEDNELWEKAMEARVKLIESVADLDDVIAEEIISDETKLETISDKVLRETIRKITLEQKAVPVLCGSSYKNIGVQCLLDGVIDYLPSPVCGETSFTLRKCFGDHLCAKAFKVRHDEHKGPVTFFRIYSGRMTRVRIPYRHNQWVRQGIEDFEENPNPVGYFEVDFQGQKMYNVRSKKNDECSKLYVPYADDYEEIAEIGRGNVVAVTGLKETTSGEMVTSSSTVFSSLRAGLQRDLKDKLDEILSVRVPLVPDPVFFCSIEVAYHREQPALEQALAELAREDPSLRVTLNEETGQTVLGGMGELHLEVIRDRIKKEYKLDVDLGKLQIAYREKVVSAAKETLDLKHELGNSHHMVKITMSTVISNGKMKEKLLLDRSPENSENISSIRPKYMAAVKTGVEKALDHGPILFCPVIGASVMLHQLEVARGTSESIVTSATVQCVKKLLLSGGTKLLEPLMQIEIVCTEKDMESIINDLGRRRAELGNTEARGTDLVVRGLVPLSELLGYAKDLRIITSGRAFFSMEFHSFSEMSAAEEAKAIKSVTGI